MNLVPMFKHLLNDIIAENIGHQLQGIRLDLAEELFLLVAICSLKFLLDEARSMLITAELDNVVVDILYDSEYERLHGNVRAYLQLIAFV